MKKFMLILFIVAIPFSVFAALDKFPATPQEIMEHQLQNSDVGYVKVKIDRQPISEESPFFTLGSVPRTRAELEALLSTRIREVINANVNLGDASLEGKKLFVSYLLWKDVSKLGGEYPFEIAAGWWNEAVLT